MDHPDLLRDQIPKLRLNDPRSDARRAQDLLVTSHRGKITTFWPIKALIKNQVSFSEHSIRLLRKDLLVDPGSNLKWQPLIYNRQPFLKCQRTQKRFKPQSPKLFRNLNPWSKQKASSQIMALFTSQMFVALGSLATLIKQERLIMIGKIDFSNNNWKTYRNRPQHSKLKLPSQPKNRLVKVKLFRHPLKKRKRKKKLQSQLPEYQHLNP